MINKKVSTPARGSCWSLTTSLLYQHHCYCWCVSSCPEGALLYARGPEAPCLGHWTQSAVCRASWHDHDPCAHLDCTGGHKKGCKYRQTSCQRRMNARKTSSLYFLTHKLLTSDHKSPAVQVEIVACVIREVWKQKLCAHQSLLSRGNHFKAMLELVSRLRAFIIALWSHDQ